METAIFAATPIAAILLTAPVQAVTFSVASGDFSDPASWAGGVLPTSTEPAVFVTGDRTMNVDGNYTLSAIQNNFGIAAGTTNVVGGPGTLTVNTGHASGFVPGIANQAGSSGGGGLRFDGNVAVNNTGGAGVTEIRTANGGATQSLVFAPSSTLTLNTVGVTTDFTGGAASIQLNGTVLGSANLMIQSANASFNAGHDSSAFGGNILMNGTGRFLAINGGTVGNSGVSLVGNYGTNEIELNAANVVNGASVRTPGSTSNLTLDVNANQMTMGTIALGTGSTLTLDLLGSSVTNLFFADSSGAAWNDGTVSILGFQEDVIKFGSDSSGLLPTQLAAIDGGIYSLTSSGFLTAVPEPSALGLFLFGAMGLAVRRKRA